MSSISDPNNGSPTPSYYAQTTTGWSDTTKANLGITKDTLSLSFTEMSPRYQSGLFGGFGYKATSSNPMLHPLEQGLLSKLGGSLLNWMLKYNELVAYLPKDVQTQLASLSDKPQDERDGPMVVLNQVLIWTAKALGEVELTETSLVDIEKMQQQVSHTAFSALGFGALVGQTIQDFIETETPNNPDYYVVINALNKAHTTMMELNHLTHKVQDLKNNEQLAETDKAKAVDVALSFSTIGAHFEKSSIKRNLNVVKDTLDALSLFSGALALPFSGSMPLYLGAHLSSIGKNNPDLSGIFRSVVPSANATSAAFASQLLTATCQFATALASLGSSPIENTSNSMQLASFNPFIPAIMTVLFSHLEVNLSLSEGVAMIGALSLGVFNNHSSQEDEQASIETAKFMACSALLKIAKNSTIIDTLFREIGAICGANEKEQVSISNIFSGLLILLIALAASRHSKRYPASMLVEQEAETLEESVKAIQELSGHFAPQQKTEKISIIMGMMLRALENRQYEEVINLFMTLIEYLEFNATALFKMIDQNKKLAMMIQMSLNNHENLSSNQEVMTFI